MIGAIAGDIIGSPYEFDPIKTEDFPLFSSASKLTDDTVLTIASAQAILEGDGYVINYKQFSQEYPFLGFGARFAKWAQSDSMDPYNSFGNGSAMRVSPIGFAFDDEETVLEEAKKSAEVTHNHPEGIKGAQAVALAILRARNGWSKEDICEEVSSRFGYDLSRPFEEVRETYEFNATCQGSVPESFIALLASNSYEDGVRKAVSLGGDSDTQACIVGAIAQPLFGMPKEIRNEVRMRLDPLLCATVDNFCDKYGIEY